MKAVLSLTLQPPPPATPPFALPGKTKVLQGPAKLQMLTRIKVSSSFVYNLWKLLDYTGFQSMVGLQDFEKNKIFILL